MTKTFTEVLAIPKEDYPTVGTLYATVLGTDGLAVAGLKDLQSKASLRAEDSFFRIYQVTVDGIADDQQGAVVIHTVALEDEDAFPSAKGDDEIRHFFNLIDPSPPSASEVAAAATSASSAAANNVHLGEIAGELTWYVRRRSDGYFSAGNDIALKPGSEERVSVNFEAGLKSGNVASVSSVLVSGSGVTVKAGTETLLNTYDARPTLVVASDAEAGTREVTTTVLTSDGRTLVAVCRVRVDS